VVPGALVSARILDGKALAATVRAEVRAEVERLSAAGVVPGLAVVLVGDDPASATYVKNKTAACREVGMRVEDHRMSAATSTDELLSRVAALNADDAVDGILVQLPLPAGVAATRVIEAIDPRKDVDGFHAENVGLLHLGTPRFVPCTPAGVMRLLDHAGAALAGAEAVVVGRSNIVGKPVAALLMAAHATVTVCHSKTRDLPGTIARADVVVAALGKPGAIRGSWIRPAATVIDVGINRGADGKLTGDVEFQAAAERAGAITPVPGGVGPMTIALLLRNTALAARLRREPRPSGG
jgi:methylenetetrahydrofolate dehydrogenase (NADP+)/methenyltetrahydrofolate cyclohydrolase